MGHGIFIHDKIFNHLFHLLDLSKNGSNMHKILAVHLHFPIISAMHVILILWSIIRLYTFIVWNLMATRCISFDEFDSEYTDINFVNSSPWKSKLNYDWYRDRHTNTNNYIWHDFCVCAKKISNCGWLYVYFCFIWRIGLTRSIVPRPFIYEDISSQLIGNFVGIVNINRNIKMLPPRQYKYLLIFHSWLR